MKVPFRLNIYRRILLMMFTCSLVSLVILSAIAISSMFDIKETAVKTGLDIGNAAVSESSSALEVLSNDSMEKLAKDKSHMIELSLESIKQNVTTVSNQMTDIMSNPEKYPRRYVAEPDKKNAGTIVPQLMYSASVRNRASLSNEIARAANIQDFLTQMNASSPVIASSYVASKNGFIIMADKISERKFAEGSSVPAPYEAFARPWYKKALAENRLIFTDVVNDIHGGGLCIICAAPYRANGEFAGVVGMGSYLREINQIVLDTKVGNTGFGFVLNQNGTILFSPINGGIFAVDTNVDLRHAEESTIAEMANRMVAGETGHLPVTVGSHNYYVAFAPMPDLGWSFGIMIEEDEAMAFVTKSRNAIQGEVGNLTADMDRQLDRAILYITLIVLAFIALVSYIAYRMAGSFVRPIRQLTNGVQNIVVEINENKNKKEFTIENKLDIKTGDEIEDLASSFNIMTDELQTYMRNLKTVTAERERIATELSVAANIQESMLPKIAPAFPQRTDFDIYATMDPAKEVGGDFYDFYLLDKNHLFVVVADVSGKGVAAALFMVIVKIILKNFALTRGLTSELASVVSAANDQLYQNNDAMMFVTAFVGILDLDTGKFSFVNAGHNPPLIYRSKDNKFSYLDIKRNFVMGGMDELDYKGQEITLYPGDKLFLYTDGVTEALNEKDEMFGEENLLSALNTADTSNISLIELLKHVKKSLKNHVQNAPQSDDITMLGLSYYGNKDA